MRICMVTSVPMPPKEGIGYYVWNLSRFLMGQGHCVQFVTRAERHKPAFEVLGGIPVWRPRFYPFYPLHVHVHGLFLQRLVAQLEGRVDLFHLHTPLPPPVRSMRPMLLTVHSMALASARARRAESPLDVLHRLQAPVSALIERQLFRICGKVTAVSGAVAREIGSLLPEAGDGVEVMWNAVDTGFFSPDAYGASQPGHLLFVGRLAPGKGLGDLVQAITRVARHRPEIKVLVAGSGPMQRKLRALIGQSRMEKHIQLLGHVDSRERLRTLYRTSWALVLPSHRESMPTVILEAMACGTPVISASVGGVPEVITDGVNGLLVPPRAPERLAGAICRLLGDPELHAQLRVAGRQTVEKRFSWQSVGAEYLRCYQALLDGD